METFYTLIDYGIIGGVVVILVIMETFYTNDIG